MMIICIHAHIDAQCTSDLRESQVVRLGMKQVNVALPDEIRGYLEEVSAKNGRKLSEEVRSRLDQSVVDDRFDERTKELARDAMWLAHSVAQGAQAASWMSDRQLVERVRASLDVWMVDLARRLTGPELSDIELQEARRLGEFNARSYAEIKPMLIKHRPGGDNMEGKR